MQTSSPNPDPANASGPRNLLKIEVYRKDEQAALADTERRALNAAVNTEEWKHLERELIWATSRAERIAVLKKMTVWHEQLQLPAVARTPKTFVKTTFVLPVNDENPIGSDFRAKLRSSVNLPKDTKFAVRRRPKCSIAHRSVPDVRQTPIVTDLDKTTLMDMVKFGHTLLLQETKSKRLPTGSMI